MCKERRLRVMINLKETGEITTIITTKEGRMITEEEMIRDEMTGDLGRRTNVEEMTIAEEEMTKGLGRMIENIEEMETAANNFTQNDRKTA